jgi:two-component system, OmpR family, KDP operon response regulator KdpE
MTDLVVLLIEDEPSMRRFLRASLPTSGHTLVEAATGREGLAMAAARPPDVILLDLGLPDMDGLEVTQRLRAWTKVPIIVLSARDKEHDKVAALDAGADDYLTKPFSMPELLARIRVARRHADATPEKEESVFDLGDLKVDLASRVVTRRGEEVRLTPIEFKLLATLVRNAGRVMTYHQLLRDVWGLRFASQKQYLHVYVGHLRHKLEDDPTRPRYLLTDAGVGYRFKSDRTPTEPSAAR